MQRCLAFVVVLAVCAPSLAAQTVPRKFGLGIRLYPGNAIYVPIALSQRMRLEPALAFYSSTSTLTTGTSVIDQTITDISLSVGWLLLHDIGADTKAYLGPRVALAWMRNHTVDTAGVEFSDFEHTDWGVAVAVGAEHFFGERFSLGAEALFGYYHAGEPHGNGSGFVTRTSYFATDVAALVRWYP